MQTVVKAIKDQPVLLLLLVFPFALAAEFAHWGALWVFALAAVSLIPMAGLIGVSTEALAYYTGPRIGGLINATLGNAAELIITLVAIRAGLLELVKASITGSILGNLLLVMGMALLLGGIKNGVQVFNRRQAGNHVILLILSVVALAVPSMFSDTMGGEGSMNVEILSLGVAVVMILVYILGVMYSIKGAKSPIAHHPLPEHDVPGLSKVQSGLLLAAATIGVVFLSEFLVGAVEHVVEDFGISEFFLGIILIPIVGNVAEHLVAVQVAVRNQMDLSMEIAISSSLQIALFVAPLLVFISLLMGHPLTLVFNQFELIAIGAGVIIAALVSWDGESNWLEGASLLGVYLILGLAFFLLP